MKKWTMLSVLLVAGALISGCGYKDTSKMNTSNTQPGTIEDNRNSMEINQNRDNPNPGGGRMTGNQMIQNRSTDGFAKRMETTAERIKDVNDATVITFGNTVLIGLDVNNKLDRTKADTVKYAVAHALRGQSKGKRVLVTADADLGKRLVGVRNGVMNGRPVSSFAKELGDIIGRIAPQQAK